MPEELRGIVTMGMLLSIPMILGGLWLINRAFKQPKLATCRGKVAENPTRRNIRSGDVRPIARRSSSPCPSESLTLPS
jgi:hypothetical protein